VRGAPVVKEVKRIAAERLSDVVDEFRQESSGAERRELDDVVAGEVALVPQQVNSSTYLHQQLARLGDALVGHAVREQDHVVVERTTTANEQK